MSFIMKSSTFL